MEATWEGLPLDERIELRKAFEANPDIIHMEQAAVAYQRSKNYIQALEVKKEIEKQWQYVIQTHLEHYKNTINETVKLSSLGLSEETNQVVVENIIIIFMACDLIETAHFNANEVLQKVNKNYSMDNFQDLTSLIGGVKRHLKFLQSETGYMDDLAWGEGCDKQYEIIRNKARAIMKKKGMSKWGQNLKKYIDGTLDNK
jgi:hypothetical protein